MGTAASVPPDHHFESVKAKREIIARYEGKVNNSDNATKFAKDYPNITWFGTHRQSRMNFVKDTIKYWEENKSIKPATKELSAYKQYAVSGLHQANKSAAECGKVLSNQFSSIDGNKAKSNYQFASRYLKKLKQQQSEHKVNELKHNDEPDDDVEIETEADDDDDDKYEELDNQWDNMLLCDNCGTIIDHHRWGSKCYASGCEYVAHYPCLNVDIHGYKKLYCKQHWSVYCAGTRPTFINNDTLGVKCVNIFISSIGLEEYNFVCDQNENKNGWIQREREQYVNIG